MGEYAKFGGESVKIGTCEDMYYLREDQRHRITKESGSVDVMDKATLRHLRFRFPWPGEDDIPPGSDKFHDNGYAKSLGIYGVLPPEDLEHHSIPFKADAGLLVSLPCPNSKEGKSQPYTIHRNGYAGDVAICGQGFRGDRGELRVILKCGACGSMYSATREQAEELVVEMLGQVDCMDQDDSRRDYYITVAGRILDGYGRTLDE